MITDPTKAVEDAVYAAISELNPNTYPDYPPGVFDGKTKIPFPITVYTVSTDSAQVVSQTETRSYVEVRLDHFADTRAKLLKIAPKARVAMLKIVPSCSMDTTAGGMPGSIYRRSQRFTGVMDLATGTIYTR